MDDFYLNKLQEYQASQRSVLVRLDYGGNLTARMTMNLNPSTPVLHSKVNKHPRAIFTHLREEVSHQLERTQ